MFRLIGSPETKGIIELLDRPVNKLVLLLESPKDRPGIPDEEPEEL